MKENTENMELTASQIRGKRNLYLCVSTLGMLVLGLIYAWSIFSGPLSAHTGYVKGDLQITFTISMIFFCLSMLAGAFINKALSIRGTLLVSAVLIAVGFAGTAMFGKTHIGVIYVCYGVLCASACGIGYNTIVARVGIWFPDRTGFASGVMMMGFGLGGLILGTTAARMIAALGIDATFYILAVIGFIVMAIIATMIKPAPPNIVREMAPQKLAAGSGDRPTVKDGYVYTSPILIAYAVFGVCAIAAGLTIIGSAKPGMETVGGTEWAGFATIFVGLLSTLNGVSRLIVGTIYDKTSLITALFVVSVVGLLASSGLAVAYTTSTPLLYIIAGLCLGFSYGGIPVVAAAFAREGFGAKNYPTNLAIVNLTIAVGAFLSQGVISMTSSDGTATHTEVWFAVIGVSAAAFLGVVVFTMMYRVHLKAFRK
jgi:OFA family oxalate/formate antiporter-like MFS transporter